MEPSGYIIVTLRFWEEDGRWVGRCEELTTGAQGKTLKEVKSILEELVELHLNGLEEIGQRKRFFREHGIKFYEHKPVRRAKNVDMRFGEVAERRLIAVPA